jgi:hypothetical protein
MLWLPHSWQPFASNMKYFFQKMDLHVLNVQIFLLLGAAVLPHRLWVLMVLTAIPQGRILTRVFIDYPVFKEPAVGYWVVNEAVVVVSVGICVMLWRTMSWV